jgi:hypothetical protein
MENGDTYFLGEFMRVDARWKTYYKVYILCAICWLGSLLHLL